MEVSLGRWISGRCAVDCLARACEAFRGSFALSCCCCGMADAEPRRSERRRREVRGYRRYKMLLKVELQPLMYVSRSSLDTDLRKTELSCDCAAAKALQTPDGTQGSVRDEINEAGGIRDKSEEEEAPRP